MGSVGIITRIRHLGFFSHIAIGPSEHRLGPPPLLTCHAINLKVTRPAAPNRWWYRTRRCPCPMPHAPCPCARRYRKVAREARPASRAAEVFVTHDTEQIQNCSTVQYYSRRDTMVPAVLTYRCCYLHVRTANASRHRTRTSKITCMFCESTMAFLAHATSRRAASRPPGSSWAGLLINGPTLPHANLSIRE